MKNTMNISICLWFDTQALEAAEFYTGIFRNSEITGITYFPDSGKEIHGKDAGTVMAVEFVLNGQRMTALNGGPDFKFNEAVSIIINCADQKETDYYWEKLGHGTDENTKQCGWLKDRYGVSWQIVPEGINDFFKNGKSPDSARVMTEMLKMKKLDIEYLRKAYYRN
ncbi:MAG: VOC family protein [Spirochaetes bacterium]|nr:VOC family protein [Spirochaetota bacterium]